MSTAEEREDLAARSAFDLGGHERPVEQEPHTVELTDLKRLTLEPGEALLVRFPRDMAGDACARAANTVARWLRDNSFAHWPVLYSRDDIEFCVVNEPERKGIMAAEENM